MILFKYHKSIDKCCWRRLIKAKTLFGKVFPANFNITNDDIFNAKHQIQFYQKTWNGHEKTFEKNIFKIYDGKLPKQLFCYINTSNYSMDDYEKGYISLSSKINDPEKVVTLVAHECSHFLFRKYYAQYAKSLGYTNEQIEELKKILTVLNNIELNIQDKGYEVHQDLRIKALKLWKRDKNLKTLIRELECEI